MTGVPDWEGPRELCQTPFSPPDLGKRGPNFRWPNSGEVPDSVASLRKEWLLLTLAGCFLLSDFVGNIGCTLSTAAVCWCTGLGAASAMQLSVYSVFSKSRSLPGRGEQDGPCPGQAVPVVARIPWFCFWTVEHDSKG